MRLLQFLTSFLVLSSVFGSLAISSDQPKKSSTACQARLFPQARIEQTAKDYVAQAIFYFSSRPEMAEVVSYSKRVLKMLEEGAIKIALNDDIETPVHFTKIRTLDVTAKSTQYIADINQLLIHPETVAMIYDLQMLNLGNILVPHQKLEHKYFENWIRNLAELKTILDFNDGLITANDVNAFTDLENTEKWLFLLNAQSKPKRSNQRQFATILHKLIRDRKNTYYQTSLELAHFYFISAGTDPDFFHSEARRMTNESSKAIRSHLFKKKMMAGEYKEVMIEAGKRAALIELAKAMVEGTIHNPRFDVMTSLSKQELISNLTVSHDELMEQIFIQLQMPDVNSANLLVPTDLFLGTKKKTNLLN